MTIANGQCRDAEQRDEVASFPVLQMHPMPRAPERIQDSRLQRFSQRLSSGLSKGKQCQGAAGGVAPQLNELAQSLFCGGGFDEMGFDESTCPSGQRGVCFGNHPRYGFRHVTSPPFN